MVGRKDPAMKKMLYKVLRGAIFELDTTQADVAEALGLSPDSFSMRMTGKYPWKQDEMYAVCDYINALAKDEGLPPPLPYEKIHEIFPPRPVLASTGKSNTRRSAVRV